jgi:hypothetical protein
MQILDGEDDGLRPGQRREPIRDRDVQPAPERLRLEPFDLGALVGQVEQPREERKCVGGLLRDDLGEPARRRHSVVLRSDARHPPQEVRVRPIGEP